MWNDINDNWKEVIKLSWESYINNTIPVGAIIVDENDKIISSGRNLTYEHSNEHPLAGTSMGHAEMIAMMKLKKKVHPNIDKYKIYVSLEPCYMCFSTMLIMGIKKAYYSVKDDSTGSTELINITEYIKNNDIEIKKIDGEIEIFQIILQTSRGVYNANSKILETWKKENEKAVNLGMKLFKNKFFNKVIKEKKDISIIYDKVLQMYHI